MADCQTPLCLFTLLLKSYHAGRADELTIVTLKEVQVSDAAPAAARLRRSIRKDVQPRFRRNGRPVAA